MVYEAHQYIAQWESSPKYKGSISNNTLKRNYKTRMGTINHRTNYSNLTTWLNVIMEWFEVQT